MSNTTFSGLIILSSFLMMVAFGYKKPYEKNLELFKWAFKVDLFSAILGLVLGKTLRDPTDRQEAFVIGMFFAVLVLLDGVAFLLKFPWASKEGAKS